VRAVREGAIDVDGGGRRRPLTVLFCQSLGRVSACHSTVVLDRCKVYTS